MDEEHRANVIHVVVVRRKKNADFSPKEKTPDQLMYFDKWSLRTGFSYPTDNSVRW